MKKSAKPIPIEEPIDYSDPGKYALKALTDAVNKLKEECRRTGRPLVVWDPKKKKVVEKYYRPLKTRKRKSHSLTKPQRRKV